MVLVAASQFFGALMNLSARILEFDGDNGGMHPFQILFARMAITTVCACIYMYYSKVPHFPLGAKEVRWLLVIRGVTGFFGIFPLWMSLMYLPLAEATVISFLAPSVAGFVCHLVIKTPFTRREQIASLLALGGVVLIARPTSLFQMGQDAAATGAVAGNGTTTDVASSHRHSVEDATPAERLAGIGLGLVGVLGAAGAFSAIRVIGTRAHPLISVTYFSVWCTIVSSTALVVAPMLNIGQPDIKFGLPASAYQWFLLIALGICGFFMQFMLTSGLGKDAKSNRANAMVYTHMLWAAGFDRFIFGHEMSGLSLAGCGLIIGSALWVALAKKDGGEKKVTDVEGDGGGIARREDIRDGRGDAVESIPMLERVDDDDDEDEEGIPLRVRAER
ncbi:putative transport protein [Rhypophila decipiens]